MNKNIKKQIEIKKLTEIIKNIRDSLSFDAGGSTMDLINRLVELEIQLDRERNKK